MSIFPLFARELRGSQSLFIFAVATMAVATAALTLVLTLSHSFETSNQKQARALLGGDASLRLSQREFTAAERQWLMQNTAAIAEARITRALAATGDRTQLIRLKGIDPAYPMFGELGLKNPLPAAATPYAALAAALAAAPTAPPPAYIGADLAQLLDLKTGDTFTAAGITLRAINLITAEPDPDPRLWAGAPLIIVQQTVLKSGAFTRPGALIQRHIRIALPADETLEDWQNRLQKAHPDGGWRLRTPENSQGTVRRIVTRLRDFLALASLAAILLAGIGCGSALGAFLRARLRAAAVLKMVGAPAATIRGIYFLLAALFAAGGTAIGVLAGALLMFAAAPLLSAALPAPIQAEWAPLTMLRAAIVSLAMCAAFAVPPILRISRINPLTLFAADSNEDATPAPDKRDRLIMATAFIAAAAALPLAWDKKILLAGIAAVALLLYGAALAAAAALQNTGAGLPAAWRLGVLAITRNRRQTAAGVMSFGVGVCVLAAIINTQNNFSARIDDSLRARAPALFLMGIAPAQIDELQQIVTQTDSRASLQTIPVIRGRITHLAGVSVQDIPPPPGEDWVVRGDRNMTWTDGTYIGASRVTEGKLWDDSLPSDILQVSFDDEAARAYGLAIGDTMQFNLLGAPVTAVVTNLRDIDWQSFDLNFVIMFNRVPFPDLPYNYMGGIYTRPDNAVPAQKQIYARLPQLIPINTAQVLNAVQQILLRASTLLQATALFLILAGIPMILATLVANRRRRLAVAATLRLLGAPRGVIVRAGIAEFLIMALLAVIPAALAGALAGRAIVVTIFDLEWQSQWPYLLAIAAAGAVTFLALGAADIARAANQSPFTMLRNE